MVGNILVTGGAGYVGSHACKALAAAGYRPIAFDNLARGHRSAVRWGPLVVGDLAHAPAIRAALQEWQCDAVLHFAGFAYVAESMRQPQLYFDNNVSNTINLLGEMLAVGVKFIVFSSSCTVYGAPEVSPIKETQSLSPINPYGETKLIVEKILRWHGACSGLRWLALRYFNAAGADPAGEIGELHDPEPHLVPLAIETALGRRPALPVYGADYPTPDGTAVRDYVHVTDLADAHVRALAYLAADGAPTALNLGTGRGWSVREIVHAVQQVTGGTVATAVEPRRSGDPAILVADPARANELLQWSAAHSDLATIIRTAWRWRQLQR